MFRRRLTIALTLLATASVLQGTAALWALNVADEHARHSRVTADIHLGFVELSARKQRLHTWVSQALLGAGADPAQGQQFQADLSNKLDQLRVLSRRAFDLGSGLGAEDRQVQRQRIESLEVLGRGFERLAITVDSVEPIPPGANALEVWNTLSTVFEESEGQNLRELVARGITLAAISGERERAAADRTLEWMRGLWLGTAAALALAALLLAAYFVKALRHPLTELASGAAALQQGDLEHRIPERGNDEFSSVARGMNVMAVELQQHRQREEHARLKLQEQVDARTSELRNALSLLQEADARRRQLFIDISHELRTPTTAIRGEAEVALRGAGRDPDSERQSLKRIVEISRQLGVVIDDVLTMARSDIDSLALDRMPLDLTVPIGEAVEQIAAVAHERGVSIELPASLNAVKTDELSVLGDPQRLRQLMLLLLDNAVLYSYPNGTVSVDWKVVVDAQSKSHCEVTVSDTGIGINAEELSKIFDRNYRGELARGHRADGTGLGLSIAAALSRAHGGSIKIESEAGKGTRARLLLPLLSEPTRLLEES